MTCQYGPLIMTCNRGSKTLNDIEVFHLTWFKDYSENIMVFKAQIRQHLTQIGGCFSMLQSQQAVSQSLLQPADEEEQQKACKTTSTILSSLVPSTYLCIQSYWYLPQYNNETSHVPENSERTETVVWLLEQHQLLFQK